VTGVDGYLAFSRHNLLVTIYFAFHRVEILYNLMNLWYKNFNGLIADLIISGTLDLFNEE
jgi:hypothetical protein